MENKKMNKRQSLKHTTAQIHTDDPFALHVVVVLIFFFICYESREHNTVLLTYKNLTN